jgi:hypothetical protein
MMGAGIAISALPQRMAVEAKRDRRSPAEAREAPRLEKKDKMEEGTRVTFDEAGAAVSIARRDAHKGGDRIMIADLASAQRISAEAYIPAYRAISQ